MHEIIDYSKNFVTGITKRVKKEKEDTPYKGVATIQLYNEKKELIQEVKSTNCITNGMLSKMYNDMFKFLLLRGKNSAVNTVYEGSPAYWMLLTNNTESENISEKNFKGNLIGYADGWKPYAGSNNLQGTLNTAETISGDWNKHFVIDFPTNAANGTFRSIYWCPDINGTYGTQVVATDTVLANISTGLYTTMCCNSTFSFITYMLENIKKINKVNLSTKESTILTLSIDVKGICCNETNIFILGDDKTLYQYTLDGVLVKPLFNIETTYARDCKLAFFNPEIVVHDDSSKTISFYNMTGTKIRSYTTNIDKVNSIYVQGTNEIVLITNKENMFSYVINILNGKISFRRNYTVFTNIGHSNRDGSAYGICKTGNNIYVNFNGYLLKCTDCDYFSHTLLPEPITKTSANTMKIQYDFVVEPRGYFDV